MMPKRLCRRLSIDHVWLSVPLAASFATLCLTQLKEGDLWWHLKIGELIATQRVIPVADTFSFTASGLEYNAAHSWLSDVVLYSLTALGDLPALVLLQAAVGSIIVALLLSECVRRQVRLPVAAGITLLGFLSLYPFSGARPQVFSFLFFTAFFVVLSGYVSGTNNRLWLLPLLMIAWTNLHGGWVMGLLLLAASAGDLVIRSHMSKSSAPPHRPLVVWGILTCLATLANPRGAGVYGYLVTMSGSEVSQKFVSEWRPPSLEQTHVWPYFVVLALLLLSVPFSWRRQRLGDSALLVLFSLLSLRFLRMIPFFIIVAIPVLAANLSNLDLDRLWVQTSGSGRDSVSRERSIINNALIALLLLGIVASLPQIRLWLADAPATTLVSAYFPLGATGYLAEESEPGARVFNMPEWGGWMIWRLYPTVYVFCDGRIELYPLQVWSDYLTIAQTGDGWQQLLQSYQVDYLLLSKVRQDRLIAAALREGWASVYEDSTARVLAAPNW